jgi:hypothetical protein
MHLSAGCLRQRCRCCQSLFSGALQPLKCLQACNGALKKPGSWLVPVVAPGPLTTVTCL